jgi:hypothetical protein
VLFNIFSLLIILCFYSNYDLIPLRGKRLQPMDQCFLRSEKMKCEHRYFYKAGTF